MPRLTINAVVARDLNDAAECAALADSSAHEMRQLGRSASLTAERTLEAALEALAVAGAQASMLNPDHARTEQLREVYRHVEAARRLLATR